MTTWYWFFTSLIIVAVVADLAFLWAYTSGNRWWTSNVGRALVQQGTVIALVLGYSTLRRLFHWGPNVGVQVALYVLVTAMLLWLAAAFLHERYQFRRSSHKDDVVDGELST